MTPCYYERCHELAPVISSKGNVHNPIVPGHCLTTIFNLSAAETYEPAPTITL
jgi:hypothetical protein